MGFVSRLACLGLVALLLLAARPTRAVKIVVDTTADTDAVDGFCSLREAILAANADQARDECRAGSGEDRILFNLPAASIILLTSDLPVITESLALRGPTALDSASTTADVWIHGNGAYRLLDFDTATGGGVLVVEDLELREGLAPTGGGLRLAEGERAFLFRTRIAYNDATSAGGGISVEGTAGSPARLALRESFLSQNVAQGGGGGGIRLVDGALVAEGSTIFFNEAAGDGGGIRALRSAVTLIDSTLAYNRSVQFGGAVFAQAGGSADLSLSLQSCTLFSNKSDSLGASGANGGGLRLAGGAGRIVELRMTNSVVSNRAEDGTARPDISPVPGEVFLVTTGWNLIGDNSGADWLFPQGNPTAPGDYVGNAASPIDPRLESTLADHGGATGTLRPLLEATSPVIDHGSCPGEGADQRGWGGGPAAGRRYDHPGVSNGTISDGCDIGAVERGAAPGARNGLHRDDFEEATLLLWSGELR